MRSLLISTAAIAALIPAAAKAAEAAIDEVVVTATRLPTAPELVTGARVIDRAELEARQTPFLTDVLSTVPGVAVARTGAFGGVSAIRIRGASPDKTLVLIDGVPVGDPADPSGTFDAGSLQTYDLDRVEVLSGPQSSLWGSEAIGGVVALTTRELDGWRLQAEAGAFETLRGFAGAGVATEAYALSATIAALRTDGISKADTGTEKDGFETFTANLAGRWAVSEALRLDGRVRYTDSTIEIDGFPAPSFQLADTLARNKSQAWSGFARATLQAFELEHQLSASLYDLDRGQFTAERQLLRWTATGEHVVVGAEHQETSADLQGRRSLDLGASSVFGVVRGEAGPITLTGSLRYDDPKAYEAKTTGRLSAAAELGAGFTLTAAAGTGFKAPTISQAVCDFCFRPPVPLVPEKAEGFDLRLGWAGARVSAAATAWRLLVRDQITYLGGRYINIAKTKSSGLEAEVEAELTPALTLKLSAAVMDAIDAATGASLIRTPDRSGAAALFWTEGPWSAALTLRAESSQSDTARDGFSRVRREGFVTADLAGAFQLNDQVALTARLENLADEAYQESFGYAEPGRALYVGVRLRN